MISNTSKLQIYQNFKFQMHLCTCTIQPLSSLLNPTPESLIYRNKQLAAGLLYHYFKILR